MEENKDIFNSELEAENSNTDTDTFTEKNDTEQTIVENKIDFSVFDDEPEKIEEQFDSNNDTQEIEYDADTASEKKNFVIQTPIIISIIIVVLVALGFLVFKCFFDTSIVGTWSIVDEDSSATADEAGDDIKTYYIFNDDGTLSMTYGSLRYEGTYSITPGEDGTQSVYMEINAAYLASSFEYSVSGNIFTGRTLVLSDSYDNEFTFKSDKRIIPEIKPDENFTAKEELTGEWNYYDGYYDITYTFNSDGTVSYVENDLLYIDAGIYSFTDDTITITYYTNEETTTELSYSIKDDLMIVNGLPYYRVGTASADEARQNVLSE